MIMINQLGYSSRKAARFRKRQQKASSDYVHEQCIIVRVHIGYIAGEAEWLPVPLVFFYSSW
jgi:hypothetical protein